LSYIIVTHRGSSYQVEANQEMCQPGGIDLAVLRFTSTRSYPVANLGDSSQIVVGRKVYASGWVGRDPVALLGLWCKLYTEIQFCPRKKAESLDLAYI